MLFHKESKVVSRELRLERSWSDYEAGFTYRLVDYLLDKKGRYILDSDGDPEYYFRAQGDKAWAEKIAKHYGLKIVKGR